MLVYYLDLLSNHVFLVSADGRMIYSEVKAFMKNQLTMTTMYKSITTSHNMTIHLSENHLISVKRGSTGYFNMM